VIDIELPETLEEITVWRLGQVDQASSYLYHAQLRNSPRCSGKATREIVHNWLARIAPMPGIVQCSRSASWRAASAFANVRVAGILVCTITQTQHNEIFGVTDA
jgi:hypothetical protein